MTLHLSKEDHDLMDKYLEKILARFKDNKIDMTDARLDLAEAIALACNDDNLVPYMRASLEEEDS